MRGRVDDGFDRPEVVEAAQPFGDHRSAVSLTAVFGSGADRLELADPVVRVVPASGVGSKPPVGGDRDEVEVGSITGGSAHVLIECGGDTGWVPNLAVDGDTIGDVFIVRNRSYKCPVWNRRRMRALGKRLRVVGVLLRAVWNEAEGTQDAELSLVPVERVDVQLDWFCVCLG